MYLTIEIDKCSNSSILTLMTDKPFDFCRHGLWVGERERAPAGRPDRGGADVGRGHWDLPDIQHHQQDQ